MRISVSSSDELRRLDNFLSSRLIQFSRTKIQKLILNGSVTVNNKTAKKNLKLSFGDKIDIDKNSFNLSQISTTLKKWDYPLEVIYKDNNFAIINKPLGIISHPTINNRDKTLVNIILNKFEKELKDHPDPLRPGIVHRLDRDTTGVMIIPFNEHAHWKIADQFKKREVQKHYIALTWGEWKKKEGIIDDILARSKKNPLKFQSSLKGKNAKSEFKLLKSGRYFSAINFYPKTGRTHQIRVHCSEKGFPIIGDELYGGGIKKINEYLPEVQKKIKKEIAKNNGHYLHAARITFKHPETKKKMTFDADPNEYFSNFLKLIVDNEI
jgi:23S rRNA pseudouridine1911/1915/1917 synthase|tara:strand:+ start:10365 stop:11336 length:972 start_codon:yes stop_codon:yes gene_type:complete